jgi:SAM-dependent methyltransferase
MKDVLGVFLKNWRVRVVLPLLQGDVLDVRSGSNELVQIYKEKCADARAFGVDVFPWPGVDQIVSHSAALPFEDASFDTVSCIAALNHTLEREGFLLEASRILRSDGCLVLTMIPRRISRVWHFLRSLWDADQRERGMEEGELWGFTEKRMRGLLENSGFVLREVFPFMFGINRLYIAIKASHDAGK